MVPFTYKMSFLLAVYISTSDHLEIALRQHLTDPLEIALRQHCETQLASLRIDDGRRRVSSSFVSRAFLIKFDTYKFAFACK